MTTSTSCPRCGTGVQPGMKFCAECGQDVTSAHGSAPTARLTAADLEQTMLEMVRRSTEGDFEILRELGRGGMAMVYLAHDLSLNRKVAIKVMSPALGSDESMVERFTREAQTAASLSHPNIIPVYAVKSSPQVTYFVMKFVPGRPLDSIMEELGAMPVEMVSAIANQVAGALGYGHKRGVVHRDVKPGNIMIDDEGWAVVTDFGIAKVDQAKGLTQTGAAIGTPTYMSPEQCTAKEVTGASDQYSLGVVVYEMLTGRKPFEGDSVMAIMYGQVNEPPPPFRQQRPDCPPGLHEAVMRMLAKKPQDRFGTMDEVMSAIGAAPLKHDDPTRTAMMTLAADGLGAKLMEQIQTPRSPIPFNTSKPGKVKSGSDPGAMTVRTSSAEVKFGSKKTSQAVAAPKKSKSLLVGIVVTLLAVTGGVVALAPWRSDTAPSNPAIGAEPTPPAAVAPTLQAVVVDDPAPIDLNQTVRLNVRLQGSDGSTMRGDVSYASLNPSVATVDALGNVTAARPGTAMLVVSSGGLTDSVPVTVNPSAVPSNPSTNPTRPVDTPRLTRIDIQGPQSLTAGQSAVLTAQGVDQNDRALSPQMQWTSDNPSVVTVDRNGNVRGIAEGNATIMASSGNIQARHPLRVSTVPVAAIAISGGGDVQVGESRTLSARVTDAQGGLLNREVQWSTNNSSRATIDAAGVLRAVGAGNVQVTASVGGQRASVEITIAEAAPTEAEALAATEQLIQEYARAFESKNLDRMVELYAGMPTSERNSWRTFFEGAQQIRYRLTRTGFSFTGSTATMTVDVRLAFRAGRDQENASSQEWTFLFEGSAWKIRTITTLQGAGAR